MKNKKIYFEKGKRKIVLNTSKVPFFREGIGLMFSKKETASALFFNFKWNTNMSIFSYFVFYPFIAIWVDEKNNFVDLKIINPFLFGIRPNKKFRKLIEIPINKKYKKVCDFLLHSSNDLLKIKINS